MNVKEILMCFGKSICNLGFILYIYYILIESEMVGFTCTVMSTIEG